MTRRRKDISIDQERIKPVRMPHRSARADSGYLHDLVLASAARETAATIVTCRRGHVVLIAQNVDIDVVEPRPAGVAA